MKFIIIIINSGSQTMVRELPLVVHEIYNFKMKSILIYRSNIIKNPYENTK